MPFPFEEIEKEGQAVNDKDQSVQDRNQGEGVEEKGSRRGDK